MNRFLQIKSKKAPYTTYQSIRIMHGSWEPDVMRPHTYKRKWDTTLSVSLSKSVPSWHGTAKLYHTDPESCMNYDSAKAMLTDDSEDANNLTLMDFDGTEYSCMFTMPVFAPKNQVPILDGSGSFWLVELKFERNLLTP